MWIRVTPSKQPLCHTAISSMSLYTIDGGSQNLRKSNKMESDKIQDLICEHTDSFVRLLWDYRAMPGSIFVEAITKVCLTPVLKLTRQCGRIKMLGEIQNYSQANTLKGVPFPLARNTYLLTRDNWNLNECMINKRLAQANQHSIKYPLWTDQPFLSQGWTAIRAVPSRRPLPCQLQGLDYILHRIWSDCCHCQGSIRDTRETCLFCPTLEFNIAAGGKMFILHQNVHPRSSAGALLLTSSLTYAAYNVGRHPVGDSRLETASGNPHSSEKPVGWGFELSDWGTLGRDRSELPSAF